MSIQELNHIKQTVKEKELAKIRWQWFKTHKITNNVAKTCHIHGISRSQFYYWKPRMDLASGSGKRQTSKANRLIAYSRKPRTNPREYTEETIKLIVKIRQRTGRGADYIWFILRDKYAIYVSVTGIYKVLKRKGFIKKRRHKAKANKTYEAPKYLPGEKIQIDTKYVKLVDEMAERRGKKYRWVYQYTALDVATGIKCKMIYETKDTESSIDFLNKVRFFYPFPIQVIQTDNGFEFTWRLTPQVTGIHPFTLQCSLFKYEHKLIPPAYPRANSHVERTHRIDEEEVYRGRTFTSIQQLHKMNLKSLKYFNEKRFQQSKHFYSPLRYAILQFGLTKQKLNYTVLNV